MNPLASTKCAGRLLVTLAAVSSILFMAACGSSNSTTVNQQGFSNASLNGTYVFSSSGFDVNGAFLAVVGTVTANGSGGNNGITGGNIDVNGFDIAPSSTAVASGNYSVSNDGRGQMTLSTPDSTLASSITLDFVLTTTTGGSGTVSTHGLITEFDGNGSGSGSLDLQTTGALSGSYSFGLEGASLSGSNQIPLAMVGTFNSGANAVPGISTNGLADINSGGTAPGGTAGLTLAASVTAGSPGTATFTAFSGGTTIATYNFDVYMADVAHLKFIETDAGQTILAGDAFTQQTSLPEGVYAYGMEGIDSSGEPIAMGGFFSSDGSSVISAGLEDYNDAGTVSEVTGIGGSFTPFSGGRTELSLNSFYNGVSGVLSAPVFAAYPSSGGMELLEVDNPVSGVGITGGFTLPQGSTSGPAAQGYGLNISADNGGGFEEDDIAQFTVDSSNNYKGTVDINDEGSTGSAAFNGTLTPDSTVAGHGSAASSTGEINFNYYIAGPAAFILETDSNQLGVGVVEAQGTAAVDAKAHSYFAGARVKPSVRTFKKRTK